MTTPSTKIELGSTVRTKFPESETGEVVDFDSEGEPIVRLPVRESSKGYEDVGIDEADLEPVEL
jgi:hypothetical protein